MKKSHFWLIIRYCFWQFQQVSETTREQSWTEKTSNWTNHDLHRLQKCNFQLWKFEIMSISALHLSTNWAMFHRCCCAMQLRWLMKGKEIFCFLRLSSVFNILAENLFKLWLFRMKLGYGKRNTWDWTCWSYDHWNTWELNSPFFHSVGLPSDEKKQENVTAYRLIFQKVSITALFAIISSGSLWLGNNQLCEKWYTRFKAPLHCAIFSATCLAMSLRDKLPENYTV